MRKSSKIIALLVTLVMLVCALAVAVFAGTTLPDVTVPDAINMTDIKAYEAENGNYRGDANPTFTTNDSHVYSDFEGYGEAYVIDAEHQSTNNSNVEFETKNNDLRFMKTYCTGSTMSGDGRVEIVEGVGGNHYLRFSGTKAGEGNIGLIYRLGTKQGMFLSTRGDGFGVIDFDFHADQYVKAGGGLTTDIAEAENGGKLAYSELNSINFGIDVSEYTDWGYFFGIIKITFEYDASTNTWYACYGGGKLPLRPELNAWNHITVVIHGYADSDGAAPSVYAHVYLDGELIGSEDPFDDWGENLTWPFKVAGQHNGLYTTVARIGYFGYGTTYSESLTEEEKVANNKYQVDDMSVAFDNFNSINYRRNKFVMEDGKEYPIVYSDLIPRDCTKVPTSLNGLLPRSTGTWGNYSPDYSDMGHLDYSVYTDQYTYPAGTPYAATITRGTDVDGFYALSQAAAYLEAGDTLTIASGLVLNYKGNVPFTAVCDEGAITLPRDSEMALVRTANGYNVVAQSTVDEVAQLMLFPTYEDYQAAISEETFTSHNFTVIQGAPIDPEYPAEKDEDGNVTRYDNYPDHYVWIIVDPTNEFAVVASDLSASDLVSAEVIAAAEAAAANEATLMIYPAPKASFTVNWYTSKDAETPFKTETYNDGDPMVAPDTTGVEGLDGMVPFNEYIDMIFGGTFVDAEGNAFVAGTTASASVDYYAVIDTPQIKAEYAKMAYVNYKLSVRQAVGIVWAPITSEEGVTWSTTNGTTTEIGGKTYGVFYDNLYTSYSYLDTTNTKNVTVTVNGKTSAPVGITVPAFSSYLKYIIEHTDKYSAADRQLALDLTQFSALFMLKITPGWSGRFVDVVYQAHKSECTDISKLTFEGDTKYDAPETLPAGVKGVTLVIREEAWATNNWRFALEVEDGFDLNANPIQVEYLTWDANGKPTTATLSFNEKVTIGGHTYVCCKDNPNSQPMATMTEDVTFIVGETRFNYNLATYIQNVEAAEGDATVARAMYAFSKTLYAYVTAPVD